MPLYQMPPLAPNVSQTGLLRTQSGWNNSSQSRRSNTTRGLLSTRTPQSMDTSSGGLLNPPLPPSVIAEAMPRGATGSFTPRISLRRPDTGNVYGYVFNRGTGQRTFTGRNIIPSDLNDAGNYVGGQFSGEVSENPVPILGNITSGSKTLLSRTAGATTYQFGYANIINSDGNIVGYLVESDSSSVQFLAYWGTANVDPILMSTTGYTNIEVTGINNDKAIVGYATSTTDDSLKGIYWLNSTNSSVELIRSQGATNYTDASAHGINNAHNIIGWVEDTGTPGKVPAYWTRIAAASFILTTLSTTEGTTTYDHGEALDINNAALPEVVGFVQQTGSAVPAYWAGTSTNDLKTLSLTDGTNSYTEGVAYGINDAGLIVGDVRTTDGGTLPVYWTDKDSNLTLLPTSGLSPSFHRYVGGVITDSQRILATPMTRIDT